MWNTLGEKDMDSIYCFSLLPSWPLPAANAHPLGLKRHSRGEDAFKEGLGGIQEELMQTRKKSQIVLYYIDDMRHFNSQTM